VRFLKTGKFPLSDLPVSVTSAAFPVTANPRPPAVMPCWRSAVSVYVRVSLGCVAVGGVAGMLPVLPCRHVYRHVCMRGA